MDLLYSDISYVKIFRIIFIKLYKHQDNVYQLKGLTMSELEMTMAGELTGIFAPFVPGVRFLYPKAI